MSLRCSLVGHDWGESEIERDRDEKGSEVVLTVREYEVCTRCDERNLISENTEVTALGTSASDEAGAPDGRAPEPTRGDAPAESPPAAGGASDAESAGTEEATSRAEEPDAASTPTDPGGAPANAAGANEANAAGAQGAGEDGGSPPADAQADDAVVLDDDGSDVATAAEIVGSDDAPQDAGDVSANSGADADADVNTTADVDADVGADADAAVDAGADADATAGGGGVSDDDGVILEDEPPAEPVEEDREHGEWPEHDGAGPDGTPSTDEVDVEQFNEDPAPEAAVEGDATVANESDVDGRETADAASPGADPTESPAGDAEPGDEGYDAELIDDDDRSEPAQDRQPLGDSPSGIKSAGSTTAPGNRRAQNGELVCPNCGNAESADRTSLRAGDICPDCKKGYLSDRQ